MQVKKTTLIALLAKAGIDPESDAWKGVTGKDAPEESPDELPAALFKDVDGKLLSLETAKTHPEVEAAAKGKFYSVIDDGLKAFLKGKGLDDAAVKTLLDGKQTPGRTVAALEKALELGKAEAGQTDAQREDLWKTKETDFKKQIDDLTSAVTTEKSGRETDRNDYALTSFLSDPANFKLRQDMPNLSKYAKMALMEAITENGAVLVTKDGKPFLATKDDVTKPFHLPGATAPLDIKDLAATTLDKQGFLNKQPGGTDQQHQQQQPQPAQVAGAVQAASSMAANDALIGAADAAV